MQSLKELYKIGRGPSSSHTLACERACKLFILEFGRLDHYHIELYGSLSLTGKGHMTDKVMIETLAPSEVKVDFKLDWNESFPNGFYLDGYDSDNNLKARWTVFSIGGGSIQIKEKPLNYNAAFSTGLSIISGYIADKLLEKPTEKFIANFKKANQGMPNLEKQVEGIKIAKPILLVGGIYYIIIPFISTFLADRAEHSEKFDRLMHKKAVTNENNGINRK